MVMFVPVIAYALAVLLRRALRPRPSIDDLMYLRALAIRDAWKGLD